MAQVEDAALTPELEAAIEKRRTIPELDRVVLLNLLAQNPWREYTYKVGRWERVRPEPWEFWRRASDEQYDWKRTYRAFQLLKPDTGAPVGEYRAERRIRLAAPSGSVWVAGDLRTVIAYSPTADGLRTVDLALYRRAPKWDALEYGRTMRPGIAPRFALVPYLESFPYRRSTWLADRPTKPTRADGYVWRD